MPYRRSSGTAGIVFHVLNRGVRRMQIFDTPTDYYNFLVSVGRAQRRTPLKVLAYCLMPNHFHFVLRPEEDGELSRFMHWLLVLHSMRFHASRGTGGTGAVYQGRFKSIPVSTDLHFIRLCRYVERNPVRARLVARAEDWPWSSLAQRQGLRRPVRLDSWPVPTPENWISLVNEEAGAAETDGIRQAVRRGAPYGPEDWRERMGTLLGLEGTLRPVGRPRKSRSGLVS